MSEDIYETAAMWHQAQTRDDMDWSAFAAWLEADPRHRAAYDDVALLDACVTRQKDAIKAMLPANDDEQHRSHRWRWTAVAAIAVVMVSLLSLSIFYRSPSAPQTKTYLAGRGQTITVTPVSGTVAVLAAGSRLETVGGQSLKLSGAAFFDVRHDPSHPLSITVAGYEIKDVGTRFDVNSAGTALRVAVAEGSVTVRERSSGRAVAITAGRALVADGSAGMSVVDAAPATIGAWRTGRFVYDNVPLALVAADIQRYTGKPVTVENDVARRRFSGILAPGSREAMVGALWQLAGIDAKREGDAIRLGGSGD